MAPVALFFLVALLLIWIYLRRLANRRRLHGRDLWNANARRLRRRHVERARTWDERRRRQQEYETSWKIAPQYLRKPPAAKTSPEGEASRGLAAGAQPDLQTDEAAGRKPDGHSGPGEGETR